ncbi:MAG TPA: nitrate- and nitrite sensing domain-containing protein [Burkholderiaceae bacterium]
MKSALHFLIAARQCEIGELEQLMRTSALVNLLGRLIHALQKERGLSNVHLSTSGARGSTRRLQQVAECMQIEHEARAAFDQLDTGAPPPGNGARLFSRIAYVLQGLDALPGLRARIDTQSTTPEVASAAFAKLIAGLLAVVFEAADSATDPDISRLLVALFNFMQGKEFAGQERATGAAAFGAGVNEPTRQQHWLHLIEQQERSFQAFTEFAHGAPLTLWQELSTHHAELAELERLRRIGCTAARAGGALNPELSQVWFDCCTRRMDAMQTVQDQLAADLLQLCDVTIAQARAAMQAHQRLLVSLPVSSSPSSDTPSFFDEAPPTPGGGGALPGYGPHLDRSVQELVQDQSQRLQAMRDELDTVRAALGERKLVERAKGLLMAHRQLSESEAHKLLRDTAMNQNRRLVDVAEAVLAMADLLPGR